MLLNPSLEVGGREGVVVVGTARLFSCVVNASFCRLFLVFVKFGEWGSRTECAPFSWSNWFAICEWLYLRLYSQRRKGAKKGMGLCRGSKAAHQFATITTTTRSERIFNLPCGDEIRGGPAAPARAWPICAVHS